MFKEQIIAIQKNIHGYCDNIIHTSNKFMKKQRLYSINVFATLIYLLSTVSSPQMWTYLLFFIKYLWMERDNDSKKG